MVSSVLIEELVEIPMNLRSLADFRSWALSEAFPEHGRIDFLQGRIEVDISPEDLLSHGSPKNRDRPRDLSADTDPGRAELLGKEPALTALRDGTVLLVNSHPHGFCVHRSDDGGESWKVSELEDGLGMFRNVLR